MSIARRLGTGFAWISAACLLLVLWLGYHEFIEEPAEYAAMGLPNIHKDTQAELSTVCFLAAIPVLLCLGWWWMRRVLAPLKALSKALESMDSHNLQELIPRSMSGDEVDRLTAVFNSMTLRLDQSFRRIHEFTLHASHELKTPLTVMRAQLETALRENDSLASGQVNWIESQIDEVKRLTNIVDSLALLTKADAGLVQLEKKPVCFNELVAEAFEDAIMLAQSSQVEVELHENDASMVLGERHRLRQLLLILTDNAVKYNQRGGRITSSLRNLGKTIELRITNTGTGIEPKTLEHVFERFVRGENAQGKVDGCGLGLTIAQWLVQAHGGGIQLLADSGGTTTALVILPAMPDSTLESGRSKN